MNRRIPKLRKAEGGKHSRWRNQHVRWRVQHNKITNAVKTECILWRVLTTWVRTLYLLMEVMWLSGGSKERSSLTIAALKQNQSDSNTEGTVEWDRLKTGNVMSRHLPHVGRGDEAIEHRLTLSTSRSLYWTHSQHWKCPTLPHDSLPNPATVLRA